MLQKFKKIFLSVLFIPVFLHAQNNSVFLQGTNYPNFFDLKKSVIDPLETQGISEKIKETKAVKATFNQENDDALSRAKRWEWYWSTRVSQDGWFPRPDFNMEEWARYKNTHVAKNAKTATVPNWSFLGPENSTGGYVGIGRVNCVAFHPTNANIMWVGTPAGGMWKTTNGGLSWTSTTDNSLPVLGVSDIAINPNYPDSIYIATGDGDEGSLSGLTLGRLADTHSVGVLLSTDGGITWAPTGLTYNVTSQALIRRVVISKSDPKVLFAATSTGIFKTTNAGTNWTMVQSGNFKDIELKPNDSNVIYAARYSGSGGAQVFVSSDGGTTWVVTSSFTGICRIKLGVTAADPNIVDALCAKTNRTFGGLYRSTDSGQSFSVIYADNQLNLMDHNEDGSDPSYGQGEYDLCYAISPTDPNKLFVGGINTWTSSDGGNTWNINTFWYDYTTQGEAVVHADKHWLAYNPNNGEVVQTNDGGIYKSNDDGLTWVDITNTIGNSQMYRISCSQNSPDYILTGLQDNGSKLYDGLNWGYATGGDGMNCVIDPVDDNIMYASYSYGVIYRSNDRFSSYPNTISDYIPGQPQGSWVTPYVLDPNDHNTIYAGYKYLYKSTDQGYSWSIISNAFPTLLTSIAVAPSNSNVIAVSNSYTVYSTTNGGSTWSNITKNIPISGSPITYIAISHSDQNTMWVTLSGYGAGNKVFKTINGGTSWINISGTLPNIPVNCIIEDKSSPNNRLFIGTDLGVFYIDDNMPDWVQFGNDLPNVVVTHLDIQYSAQKLRAATFGRGVWEVDLNGLTAGGLVAKFTLSSPLVCLNESMVYTDNSIGSVNSYSWSFGQDATPPTATGPGPFTVSYSTIGNKTVSLNIQGNGGNSINTKVISVVSKPTPVITYVPAVLSVKPPTTGLTFQWQFAGVNIPGATQSKLYLNATSPHGNYSCVITNSTGCSGVSNIIDVQNTIGIETINGREVVIEVFPNPASSMLNISENTENYLKSVSIIDISGNVVLRKSEIRMVESIDISGLVQGNYFIKMETPKGYTIKKLQIKR